MQLIPLLTEIITYFCSFWLVRFPVSFGRSFVKTWLRIIGETIEHLLFSHRKKSNFHKPISYVWTDPITPSYVNLEDGETCYYLLGPKEGPLIILLHGFSFYSVLWNFYAKDLVQRGYRVLLFDFYGQGYSEVPSAEKTKILENKYWKQGWELLVCQTDQLLIHLNLHQEKSIVIGHSMGGLVSAKYCERFPERVEKLILMNTVGSPCHIDFFSHPLSSLLNVLQWIGDTPILGEIVILGIGAVIWLFTQLIPPDTEDLHNCLTEMDLDSPHKSSLEKNISLLWTAWSCQMQRDSGRPRVLLHALRHLPFFGDHLSTFEELDKNPSLKILLIWGLNDSIFPQVCLDNFLCRMPNTQKAILPDTNHSSFLERPWTVLNQIHEFLGTQESSFDSQVKIEEIEL